MRKHQKLTSSLRLVEGDVIRPLRTGWHRPGRTDVYALAERPRWEIETLLEEKEHEASSPGWGYLMSFVGVVSAAFSAACALLIAFAGFMTGDPRLREHISVSEAGHMYVETAQIVGTIAITLVAYCGVLVIRAIIDLDRCRRWIWAAKSALRLIEERSEARNAPKPKNLWGWLKRHR